jgi:ribA/ribD-fused uncharacterized protein
MSTENINIISSFDGDFRFLSNFWPCEVNLDGEVYSTTEHAYQASKSIHPGVRKLVRELKTPGQAKRFSHKITKRPDWLEVRQEIMLVLNRQKFAKGSDLAEMLLLTGDAFIKEGNTWHDNDWGSCTCVDCGDKGQNMLGLILMKIRDELNGNAT